ncbi:MAG: D-aminoacyl-tRNA deacylase [Ignavibacteria bacterium]
MIALVQRVGQAHVEVDGRPIGSIGKGLLVLLGITHTDSLETCDWIAKKLVTLRIFADDEGKMNKSVVDVGGSILVVSQFTLYGELAKGTRPSFIKAARPEHAEPLYNELVQMLHNLSAKHPNTRIETGSFGAMMDVHLTNDGPVTLIIER